MKTLAYDVWSHFRSLPVWVQIWVALILVPVNLLSVFYWQETNGPMISLLAIGGMAPNVVLMIVQRGFGKAMAISHLIFWIPLLVLIVPQIGTSTSFQLYLLILFIVNLISVFFDINDTKEGIKGDRAVSRK